MARACIVLHLAISTAFLGAQDPEPRSLSEISLEGGLLFSAGSGPSGLVPGDFQGDGVLDLASGGTSGRDPLISIHPGQATGWLGNPLTSPANELPTRLFAGDFNGDGALDIAIGNGNDFIHLYWNDGAGVFAPGPVLQRSVDLGSPIAVDLEADGSLDVVAAQRAGTKLVVFQNAGGGAFEDPLEVEVGSRANVLEAADLDGDAFPELFVESNKVLLFANSAGFLQPGIPIFEGETRPSLRVGDLNADSFLDVAVATYSPDLTVLLGSGPATFLPPVGNRTTIPLSQIAIEDLDGDGDRDLVATNDSTGRVQTLIHEGDASFATRQVFLAGTVYAPIVLADLSGDGRPDLALARVAQDSAQVGIWRNRGEGSFAAPQELTLFAPSRMASLSDFDGDGIQDLAVNMLHAMTTLPLLSSKGFTGGEPIQVDGSVYHAAVDSDLDGDQDLITANSSANSISFLENAGSGAFSSPRHFPSPGIPRLLSVWDLDGEGGADIAVAKQDPAGIEVFRNTGSESFESSFRWTFEQSYRIPTEITQGDLDGDGKSDVIVSTEPEETFWFENKGSGAFDAAVPLPQAEGLSIAAADLDGDGDLDLVTSKGIATANRGDGTFETRFFVASISGTVVRAVDLDRDGDPDPIILSWLTDQLLVIQNLGNLIFQAPRGHATGRHPRHLAVGDVDLGASPDIVVTHEENEVLLIVRTFSPPQESFHRGDANADGSLNIGDGLHVLEYLFRDGSRPSCLDAGDANDDGALDVSDAIVILNYLFLGTAVPAPPGPPGSPCGADPTEPSLGCQGYPVCPPQTRG